MFPLNQFFLDLLNLFAGIAGGNYGLAIIFLTLAIRLTLLPLVLPSLKSQKKIKQLKPQLDQLKKKYSKDKQLLAKKQMELYQKNNINLASGCLPQLVQIVLFIAFYRVLITSLNNGIPDQYSVNFLWLKLNQPDNTYLLPFVAAASQLLLALMLSPGTDTAAEKELSLTTKTKKDDKQADDMTEMAQVMQSQMILIMPAMTFFIALRFPSGLAVYWVVSTLFSLVQQYFVSGLGGLKNPKATFSKIISGTKNGRP